MSVRYVPVQWNRNKWLYDGVLVALVVVYVWVFLRLGAPAAETTRPVDGAILRMRAFGSCAFLMLSAILCIGPLARLDARFLPLLYNRRHFGVLTALVALTHAVAVLDWYYAFGPTPPLEALLDLHGGWTVGVPFEAFGIFGLVVLAILAATSHDFWLDFLTPPVWKALHLLIYPAYAALCAHVAFGYLQDADNPAFALVFAGAGAAVVGLGLAARARGAPIVAGADVWVPVGRWDAIADGRATVVRLGPSEAAAVFRDGATLSAISNACAHQNGPLGEGRILDGCVTCPWHGFQYRAQDGRAPAPYTERVATYRLRLVGPMVEIDRRANPPGTFVEPLRLPAAP